MILVEISSKEVLRQLPHKAGYALLQYYDEMPKTFKFEALPLKDPNEVLEEMFPKVRKALTNMEWLYFSTLYNRGWVRRSIFSDFHLKSKEFVVSSNVVDVGFKNIRSNLVKNKLPFRIETKPASVLGQTYYKLIKL